MTITRKLNGIEFNIYLTEEEVTTIYKLKRAEHFRNWVWDLLVNDGYDPEKMSQELFDNVYDEYMDNMEEGDRLGELEHDMFNLAVENFSKELEPYKTEE